MLYKDSMPHLLKKYFVTTKQDSEYKRTKILGGIVYLKEELKGLRRTIVRFLGIEIYKTSPKTIVFYAHDGLGDYILRRNFFESIKSSKKYKDHKIVLLVIDTLYDFVRSYDKCADEVILLKEGQLGDVIKTVNTCNVTDIVDVSVYTWPDKSYITKKIIKGVRAKNKIAFKFDLHNGAPFINRCYTKVIEIPERILFEFERNRLFFSELIGETIEYTP